MNFKQLLNKMIKDKRIIIDHLKSGKPLSELKEKGIKLVKPL